MNKHFHIMNINCHLHINILGECFHGATGEPLKSNITSLTPNFNLERDLEMRCRMSSSMKPQSTNFKIALQLIHSTFILMQSLNISVLAILMLQADF